MQPHASDTDRAATATLEAVHTEHDFGGWLAGILARTAAELGSTHALTAGRPGSWEVDLVQRLINGTVGWDDELLEDYISGPHADCYSSQIGGTAARGGQQ
jgi:hypothetical protein